nr:DUF6337 family protein [Lachnospiraceae bacterium]
KAFLFLTGFSLVLFVGNYWISFILRDISFSSSFAVSKVWTYVAGGTITNDVILKTECNSYTFKQWLLSIPSGLVNLFSSLFVGKPLIENAGWGHIVIGQTSYQVYWTNVFSLLTYMTQYSTLSERIITSVIVGFAGELAIPPHEHSNDAYTKPTRLFIISFIFLNFFSNYFTLSGTWELIGWCMLSGIIIRILPYFTLGKGKKRFVNNR